MGILKVRGIIDTAQFWPKGRSDADTVVLKVTNPSTDFVYQEDSPASARPVSVFAKAYVKIDGKTGKKDYVVHNNHMTIRLQGIDAPELHFRPAPLSKTEKAALTDEQCSRFKECNKEYRQFCGESSAEAIFSKLSSRNEVPCVVTTVVKSPNDVFDVYGRFIGDIYIDGWSLNHWLLEEGWAMPAFYDSMLVDEIEGYRAAANRGRAKGRLWDHYTPTIPQFNSAMTYRQNPVPKEDLNTSRESRKAVLFPKLFRRQTSCWARDECRAFSGSFQDFLNKGKDELYLLDDYVKVQAQGKKIKKHTFGTMVINGTLEKEPDQLVFIEKASTLHDDEGNVVQSWW